jgi:hypothetical protein
VRAEMENKIFMPKHSLLFGLPEEEEYETNFFKSQRESHEESKIDRQKSIAKSEKRQFTEAAANNLFDTK